MPQNPTEREAPSHSAERAVPPLAKHLSELRFAIVRSGDTFALLRAPSPDGRTLVALVSNDSLPSSPGAERLKREHRLSGKLEPEWALRAFAYTVYEGRPALLFDDCDAEPLDIMISSRDGQLLDLKSAINISCELASTVRKMHERGIIHKDINPSNVFVGPDARVRLTGFGFAAQFDDQTFLSNTVTGTYAYMAPEQTGRMNRPTDSRSDLYSLGITIYQLLTGSLPFSAETPTEWIHSHIARKPVAPTERVKGIPEVLDAIVLRLLAKDPDDRYQSARGVESDLRRCLATLTADEAIASFELCQNDISDRLSLPERLYGRGAALESLIEAAKRVTVSGRSEIIIVAGGAGTGKSSLVKELHSAIRSDKLFFATGKFDQYKRDIPYSTLAQAFRHLIRLLLTKPDQELASWRQELLVALGSNARLMIGLIPELALVIGEQPSTPEVDLQSTQARFHLVFGSLLRVFAKPDHPLILFVDDLQWLDPATLELLERIAAESELNHLLVVGAYRDDEVSDTHPLLHTIDALRLSGRPITTVALGPLNNDDLASLVSDNLGMNLQDVRPLAELILEKTAGNPFFAVQFIREIAGEGLLRFNPHTLRWSFDVAAIRAKGITDNVAHLIAMKLERLPPEVRHVLTRLALLGSATDLQTISLIHGEDATITLGRLRLAEEAGLIRHEHGVLSFIHDHVQEVAYSLISPSELPDCHLRAARLLLSNMTGDELESNIFEIVSQLDRAISIVNSPSAQDEFANLYLIAGRRAKSSGAFSSASSYFAKGRMLLGDRGWFEQPRISFELELNQAECEIVARKFTFAECRLSELEHNVSSLTDLAGVACLAILLHFTMGRSQRAVEVGLEFLTKAKMGLPRTPGESDVRYEYEDMHRRLALRLFTPLADLPAMTDPTIIATMAVLTELFPAAYAIDRHLMEFVLLRMVNLSLEYGNCASSSVAYSALNMAIGSRFRDYKTAFAMGQVAVELVNRRESDRYKARVYSCFAAFAMPWTSHVSQTRSLTMQAFQISSSMGDLAFAAYNLRNHITHLFISGAPLEQVQQEAEFAISFAKDVQLGIPPERFFAQLRLVKRLRASIAPDIDDDWAAQNINGPPGLAMMACYHWVFRLQEHYFAGDYRLAMRAAARLDGFLWAMRSSVEEAEFEFFYSLSIAASCDEVQDRRESIEALSAQCERLSVWNEHGPDNFGCRKALLDAELARLRGDQREAQDRYEDAVRLARLNSFIQIEALASELASKFYRELNLTTVSDFYLRNSYTCYEKWGCLIKLRQIELRHPHLLRSRSSDTLITASEVPIASIDAQIVGQASKTLSSEMVLSVLIEKLMRLAVQHAGAERGLLLLIRDGELTVEASASIERGGIEVQVLARKPSKLDIPHGVINYVSRTHAPLILDDGVSLELEYSDEYLRAHCPKSLLCLPILKSTEVIGFLYLENTMTARAFTPDRTAVLDFLASQSAIWLENARLYSDLRRSEAWLREAQHLSRTGSFFWAVESDTLELSEEMYRICEIDQGDSVTMKRIEACVHPEDMLSFRSLMSDARQSTSSIAHKFRIQMPDFSVKHLQLVAHSGRTPAGELRYIGAVQDVTEQHLSQQALGHARSELARVARATTLGGLIGSIAHEVHQPLLGIVTNAATCVRMLSQTPPNIEGARRTAQRSIRDGHRAADMIRRLQGIFAEGGGPCEFMDTNDAAREVIALLTTELNNNQVVVETDLVEVPLVWANRVQIQQVIMNFIMNAAEAMRDVYEFPRRVLLSTHVDGVAYVRLDVKDCGLGFNEDVSGQLFEAFYTTKMGGLGMGLSISRSIIESYKGRIWASLNSEGPGSTFSFSLPIGTPS